jgi:F-type H+-transporting ATPase subunit delta
MTSRAIASRYARALFDVASKESDPARIGEQLQDFADTVAGHPDLPRVLHNPAVPVKMKHGIVAALTSRVPMEAPLARLLLMLADRDRLALVVDVAAAYRDRLLDHQRVVEAHVTTAAPLPPDRADALALGLAAKTGRQVRLTTAVDPALLGGVVARIGSTVYDGSVARHLERLRDRLAQDA